MCGAARWHPVYGFESYHVLLTALGGAIIIAYWLPRFVSGREPAASALLILLGLIVFAWVPGMPAAINPVESPRPWEIAAELCVIIGLFGVGLRIDRVATLARWRPTLRLLLIAMPLTIISVALLGWLAAGMTLTGAILLGAILAPTDPVLASDVQVGPPLEGGEHPVRYTLTTEAGLNDGLAFPFVHLGLVMIAAGSIGWPLAQEWLLRDVLYRVAVGAASGMVIGWLLAKTMFDWPRENALAKTEAAVIALAGVLLAYGATELVEGYGFIGAFVAGVTLRRCETDHDFHRRLHDFSQALEHAFTAVLLVALGAALPALWPYLGWSQVVIGLGLILVIRPAIGWLSLIGTELRGRERATVAIYGVRGIGSIYYLAYAGHHAALIDEPAMWATVAFTVLASTILHGLTAGIALDRATGEGEAPTH